MPIDKRDTERSESRSVSLSRIGWGILFAFVCIIWFSFLGGVLVHFIVEFFQKGWNLVG